MADSEYDPMNPENDEYSGIGHHQQYQQQHYIPQPSAPLPLLFTAPLPPPSSLLPSTPVAPWLLNSQIHPPLPPSIPLPSMPLPQQSIPLYPPLPYTVQPPPPQYPDYQYVPPPPPQSIVPAPPQSSIPPPPPPNDSEVITVGVEDTEEFVESAYSPSQAEDEQNEEKNEIEKREQNAILLSQQKQKEIENILANKERENMEHTRRMEMENKKIEELKKRKMMNGFGPIKLQKKKLKGFEDQDEDVGNTKTSDKEPAKERETVSDQSKDANRKASQSNSITTDQVLTDEKIKFMSQVATYIIGNPTQAAAFIRSKKGVSNFEFLFDVERVTKEGKKYREISERFQAEKNVHNVCNDGFQGAVNNNDSVSHNVSNMSKMAMAVDRSAVTVPMGVSGGAGVGTGVGVVDYSVLNPFGADRPSTYRDVRAAPLILPVPASTPTPAPASKPFSTTFSTTTTTSSSNSSSSSNNSSSSSSGSGASNTPQEDAPKSSRRNRWGPSVAVNSITSSGSVSGVYNSIFFAVLSVRLWIVRSLRFFSGLIWIFCFVR